jgi:hypothetical protein
MRGLKAETRAARAKRPKRTPATVKARLSKATRAKMSKGLAPTLLKTASSLRRSPRPASTAATSPRRPVMVTRAETAKRALSPEDRRRQS